MNLLEKKIYIIKMLAKKFVKLLKNNYINKIKSMKILIL